MNAPEQFEPSTLPDVQSEKDSRQIAIQKVGVRGIKYPVKIKSRSSTFPSVADIDMTVSLESSVKGTHMSRFIEVLEASNNIISYEWVLDIGKKMINTLEAESGWIKLNFPFFLEKKAPVSQVAGLLNYEVAYEIECTKKSKPKVFLEVVVPVTSLCPCSKNISEYGAHNQRSHITVKVELRNNNCHIEDFIKIAEESASCELWSILKRPDEKFVTEKAYDNPKFVEDLVRDVALELQKLVKKQTIGSFSVDSENFESIHNHSAFARIEQNPS